MDTATAQPNNVGPSPPYSNAEPGAEWKESLRKQIEENLLPMYNDAKETLNQKLREAPVDEARRERLVKEHHDTLKNIRRIADDIFRDQIEEERQQLLWARGETVDSAWSGGLVKQQQAILEQIERERATSRRSSSQVSVPNQQSQGTPGESPTSERDGEYFSRNIGRNIVPLTPGRVDEDRMTGRSRNTSATSGGYDGRYSGERMGDYSRSAIVDEPEEMDRPGKPYPEGKSSLRRQSTNAGHKAVPEIWKPSISPEEDAHLSRPSVLGRRGSMASIQSNSHRSPSTPHFADRPEPALTRQGSASSVGPNSYRSPSANQFPDRPEHRPMARQGSISSIGSHTYRPPSTSQIIEHPEPNHGPIDIAARTERERMGVQAAEEEWSEMNKARERREGRFRSASGSKRVEDRTNLSSPTSTGPSPVSSYSPVNMHAPSSRPVDIRSHSSGLSASRPIPNDRPFTVDESPRFPQSSSPLSQGWAGQTRSATGNRMEPSASRSPPRFNDTTRLQQPPHLRPRVSTQNLQHDHRPPMMSRSTSNINTELNGADEDGSEAEDDDWQEQQNEEQRQAELIAQSKRIEEETKRKEEIKRMEQEAQHKAEEAQRKEAEARRRAEEAERLENEARAKEEAARLKEEETRKKEAEIKRREEEVRRREADLERREAEARRKEEEKRRMQQEEARKRDLENRRRETEKREAEVRLREQDLERREAEARRREEEEKREEQEAIRQVEELERREAEAQRKEQIQQEQFRKREEEIRRRTQERKSQEYEYFAESARPTPAKPSTSPPSTAPWPIPNRSGSAGTPSQADRNGTSATSWTSSSSRPSVTPSTPASTRTSASSTATKPASSTPRPAGFSGAGAKIGTTPHPSTPNSQTEWARRQEEQARKQQEAFRREQEQQELKRQAQASKILTKEDVLQLFSTHERQWAAIPNSVELFWHNFPWPVWKPPKDPEDLTSTHIGAYVLSQYYPGGESKSSKDRIKEHIRRWHPDRFETKYLPKVIQEDREKVQEGAGVVVRVLNEMLMRSNFHDVFS